MTIMKSAPVTAADNVWMPAELTVAKKELNAEIARARKTIDAAQADCGPQARKRCADGEDTAYVGTLVADMGAGTLLADNSEAIVMQCELALERIGQLRYGTCDMCAQPIAKERLLAMPRVTMCTTCQ